MVAREQFAWVWLVTMIITYAGYFAGVAVLGATAPFWTQLGLFAGVAATQVLIVATAAAVIALRNRDQSADERDRAIENRAAAMGYNVLILGIILVGCVMPFSHSGWSLFHAAVLMIGLAEIVRHGLIVAMYRRGWHG